MKTLAKLMLSVIFIAIAPLNAMEAPSGNPNKKRPREEGEGHTTQPLSKKARPTLIKLICTDGKKFGIPLSVVKHSATLLDIAQLVGIVNNDGTSIETDDELKVENINSNTMLTLLPFMFWIDKNEKSFASSKDIITALVAKMSATTNFTQAQLIALLNTTSFLDIPILLRALIQFTAQNLDKFFPCGFNHPHANGSLLLSTDLVQLIAHTHYLMFGQSLTVSWEYDDGKGWTHQIKAYGHLEVNDLVACGAISPEFATKDMADYLTKILEGTVDSAELQASLELLYKFDHFEYAQEKHCEIFNHVKKLSKEQMEGYFENLTTESALKMALRLVYWSKFNATLDDKDLFIMQVKTLINQGNGFFAGFAIFKDEIDQINDLKYLLGFLKPFFEQEITELCLYGLSMKELPDEICMLTHLKKLNVAHHAFEKFPPQILCLANLEELVIYSDFDPGIQNFLDVEVQAFIKRLKCTEGCDGATALELLLERIFG